MAFNPLNWLFGKNNPQPQNGGVRFNVQALGNALQGASRVYDQVNPFDNGLSYKTRQVNAPPRSVVRQAGRIAAPIIDSTGIPYFVKADIINPARELSATFTGNKVALRNARRQSNIDLGLGAQGTNFTGGAKKLTGNTVNIGTTFLAPGASKGLTSATERVLPKAVPKVIPQAVSNGIVGAGVGAVGNTGNLIASGEPITKEQLIQNAKMGALFGGVLGAGGTLAAPAAKAGIVKAKPTAKVAVAKAKSAPVQAKKALNPHVAALDDQIKLQEGAIRTSADATTRRRHEKALDELIRQRAEINKRRQSGGGFLGNEPTIKNLLGEEVPNPAYDPLEALKQEARKYKSADEPLYRGVTASEWNDLQNGGVSANKRTGRAFVGTKDDAQMAVEAHARSGKKGNVIIEYKPSARQKLVSGGNLGENTGGNLPGEYQAKGLGLSDIARVTDENGKVVYEDPALYNQAHAEAGKPSVDPLADLKQEARKYKSAEEFVKAQGQPLYHGSPNHEIIRKEGFKSNPNGNNLLGEGVYMTRHRVKAENYSLPSDLPRGTTITQEMRSAGVVEGYIPKGSKIYQPETRAELKNISTKELQQQGFDGIEINGETVIFDQSKIKTREQLTDLYNQAVGTAPVEKTPKPTLQDALEGRSTKLKTKPAAPPKQPPVTKVATAAEPQLPQRAQTQALAQSGGDMRTPTTKKVSNVPKGKETRFASKTVPESEYVSQPIREQVKENAPTYDVQTERSRFTEAASRLKQMGEDNFETDVMSRLDKKKGAISSQDATDAITLAQVLDAKKGDKYLQKASDIYEKLSEHFTAAGQTIQAAAILSRRTPEGLRFNAERTLKKAGVEVTPQIQTQIKKLIDDVKHTKTQPEKEKAIFKLSKYVDSKVPSSVGDKVINIWRAGLLTAPTTTGGNILGNTGEALVRKGFVNPVATLADKAMSIATGKRTMTLGKAGAGAKGFKEGVGTLPEYLKTGYDPRQNIKKYDVNKELNYGDGKLGKSLNTYVNGVYRLMGTADAPFSTLAEKEALSSIAKAEAINRGLKGAERAKFVDDFIANPPTAALERATKEADYATFKNPTTLGKAASGLKKPLGAAGDFVVPFTQVPAAIATRLIERTPVGIAKEVVSQIKAVKAGEEFDQRAMAQAIGNGTFGVVAIGAGMSLAKDNLMTFGYPSDAKERKLWESEGKQPYSVRVGDRWYSLNYLQPFGMLLAIGGQAHKDVADGKEFSQVITKALATAGQAIQEQSFLKGINGILDAISDPERSAQKLIENTGSSVVPNVVRSGVRAADPVQRKPETLTDAVKSGIPGKRGEVPTKDDMFGNPLPAKDNFLNQYVNPLKPSKVRENDTTAELRRLQEANQGAVPTEVKKDTFKNTTLTPTQLKELNSNIGKAVKPVWEGVMADRRYKSLSDEDKKSLLQKVSSDMSAIEKAKFAAKNNIDWEQLNTRQKAIINGEEVDYLKSNDKTQKVKISKPKTPKIKKARVAKMARTKTIKARAPKLNTSFKIARPKAARIKAVKLKSPKLSVKKPKVKIKAKM